jgi:hypothetical protein
VEIAVPPIDKLTPSKFFICDNAGVAATEASSAKVQQIFVVLLVIIFPLLID